jgi:DNA-binding NarL/FixJ family response regulator
VRVFFIERPSERAMAMAVLLKARGMEVIPLVDLAAARARLQDRQPQPDVILMNAILPDGRAEDLLPTLVGMSARPRVVMVAPVFDRIHPRAYQYGVAVVPDPFDPIGLVDIVWSLSRCQNPGPVARFQEDHALSEREAEIVALAAQGADNKEIAQSLECGIKTVQTHWMRIYDKTGHCSVQEVMAALLRMSGMDWPYRMALPQSSGCCEQMIEPAQALRTGRICSAMSVPFSGSA